MNGVWVTLLLLVSGSGTAAETPEQAAGGQEKALAKALEQAQSSVKLDVDARLRLQIQQSTLQGGIEDFQELLHAYGKINPKMGIQGFWNNRVHALQKNGPAAKAGMLLGDKIVGVNGQDVEEVLGGIGALAAQTNPVTLTVEREGTPGLLTFVVLKEPSLLPDGFLKEYDKRLKSLRSRAKGLGRRINREDSKNREAMELLGSELNLLQADYKSVQQDAYAALGYETLPKR